MSAYTIQIPALCIPRVFHRVTKRVLYGTFERLFGKGCVAELTMVPRSDRNTGEPYHIVFIRFNAYSTCGIMSRNDSVSPTIEVTEKTVFSTTNLIGDEMFDRISKFITQLEEEKEIRIEYHAPYFFKVSKYLERKPRMKPLPRILPVTTNTIVHDITPEESDSEQSFIHENSSS